MKKWKLSVLALAALFLWTGCGGKGLPAEAWVDYYMTDDMPWGESRTLTLPEFPGVTFTWTPEEVTAASGGETARLFEGMPVWSVFLCDLTGDGKPELCATVSMGSGIVDDHVEVYDYAAGTLYRLADRGFYDYVLIGESKGLQVVKSQNRCVLHEKEEAPEKGTLALVPDGGGNLRLVMEKS